MARSLSGMTQLTCPHCQHEFTVELWLIVDPGERPELRAPQQVFFEVREPVQKADAPALPDSSELRAIQEQLSRPATIHELPARVELCRRALSLVSRESEAILWADLQVKLGKALSQNPQGSRAENIEQAIACYEQALQVRTREARPQEWAESMRDLGIAFSNRVRGTRAENLEQAIACFEQTLLVRTREAMPHKWACMQQNLGTAYYSRIRGTRAENLEQAIACFEQALLVLTREAKPVEWAFCMTNLGNAFCIRICGTRAENLERAIACYEQALLVRTREARPVEWASTLMNLGNAYPIRVRGTRAENLEHAIACYMQALRVWTREDWPIECAITQMNLGNTYRSRIRGTRAENMEQAIACLEQTLQVWTRETMPVEWAMTQMNLGTAYADRIRGSRAENLEQAIAYHKQALQVRTREAMPEEWAHTLFNLGVTYAEQIQGTRVENLAQAIACYEQALQVRTREQFPAEQAQTLKSLGILYLGRNDWELARATFSSALQTIDMLYEEAPTPDSRRGVLTAAKELPAQLAYALARMGDTTAAAVLLERFRARWLLESLAPVTECPPGVPPSCWSEFTRTRDGIAELLAEFRLPEGAPGRRSFAELAEHLRQARADFRTKRDELRQHAPGFLRETSPADLEAALVPGQPIVYLGDTPVGGFALILHPLEESGAGGLLQTEVLWLDQLDSKSLREQVMGSEDDGATGGWLGAYTAWQQKPNANQGRWFAAIDRVTRWLGGAVMAPLTARLTGLHYHEAVVIPSGHLALLPLAAAWTGEDSHRRYALDELVFTFAPSAFALRQARHASSGVTGHRLLAIADPQPQPLAVAPPPEAAMDASGLRLLKLPAAQSQAPLVCPLPGAVLEAEGIAPYFPLAPQVLQREAATLATVLELLPSADVAHFSCHGVHDWDEPGQSGLLLSNREWLTVNALLRHQRQPARLAFLSACETGLPDMTLPDEAIGLPSALLHAGFAGAAATLWSVQDLSTALLVERFYFHWRQEGLAPAVALREAQRWLRDTTNSEKAGLFQRLLREAADTPRSVTTATTFVNRISLDYPSDERSFAHPAYWAAFYYTGV